MPPVVSGQEARTFARRVVRQLATSSDNWDPGAGKMDNGPCALILAIVERAAADLCNVTDRHKGWVTIEALAAAKDGWDFFTSDRMDIFMEHLGIDIDFGRSVMNRFVRMVWPCRTCLRVLGDRDGWLRQERLSKLQVEAERRG